MISLVLPVYNCFPETAQSIPRLVDRLSHIGIPFEIILVDDDSKDSGQYRELAAANHCIYFKNEKNYGKGFSVRRGFAHAVGSVLIFMDGDFPFELEVIDQMVELFRNQKIDIAIGDRSLKISSYPPEKLWLRKIGSNILSFFSTRYI